VKLLHVEFYQVFEGEAKGSKAKIPHESQARRYLIWHLEIGTRARCSLQAPSQSLTQIKIADTIHPSEC